jgi:hypothetical protein
MSALFAIKPQTLVCLALSIAFLLFAIAETDAQKRRPKKRNQFRTRQINNPPAPPKSAMSTCVVVDERLSVLRFEPSLMSVPLQRVGAGRTMTILGERATADGVTFYRVELPPEKVGWVQSEAVVTGARRGDDARLARLIRASDGFEQIERASIFLETFPMSPLRPAILLLSGDLAEEQAAKMSRDAVRRFEAEEMDASGAPMHSFYLNFNALDRYRRLGINFVFNQKTKQFHYDGATWREIVQKHRPRPEASEAQKRLDALAAKMKK